MPEFSYLNVDQLVTAQAGHAVTANAAIEALAKGVGAISVSVESGNVTLTEDESRAGVIRLTGAPGAARVVTVDADISRAILFVNDTTGGQTIEVEQTGGTNFTLPHAGGCVLLLSTTAAVTFHPKKTSEVFFTTGGTWTNMPAALTEWLGFSSSRAKRDLAGFTECRLIFTVGTAGAATPAKLRMQYSSDGSAWSYMDGTSGPSVDIDTIGVKVSAWVTLAQAARTDVFLRIAGIDGDATADPVFTGIRGEFR